MSKLILTEHEQNELKKLIQPKFKLGMILKHYNTPVLVTQDCLGNKFLITLDGLYYGDDLDDSNLVYHSDTIKDYYQSI